MTVRLVGRAAAVTAEIEQTYEYTAGEALTAKCAVCLGESESKVYKAKADGSSTMPAIGIAKDSAAEGDTVQIYQFGTPTSVKRDGDFNKDDPVFVSPLVAGNLTNVPPSENGQYIQPMGRAINGSDIVLEVDPRAVLISI